MTKERLKLMKQISFETAKKVEEKVAALQNYLIF